MCLEGVCDFLGVLCYLCSFVWPHAMAHALVAGSAQKQEWYSLGQNVFLLLSRWDRFCFYCYCTYPLKKKNKQQQQKKKEKELMEYEAVVIIVLNVP